MVGCTQMNSDNITHKELHNKIASDNITHKEYILSVTVSGQGRTSQGLSDAKDAWETLSLLEKYTTFSFRSQGNWTSIPLLVSDYRGMGQVYHSWCPITVELDNYTTLGVRLQWNWTSIPLLVSDHTGIGQVELCYSHLASSYQTTDSKQKMYSC